jgi:hypothetical protein
MLKMNRSLPALMLAVCAAVAAPACAAQTYGYGYPGNGGYARELEQRAYDNGFREGAREGQTDARRGRDFSYQRHDEYRDADRGYRRGDGDFDLYRRSYRQGFQTGYSDAYARFAASSGRYPRGTYGSGSPAAQNGHRDGVQAGREDARNRERFDPVRASRYREGDHDYNGRYGSRDDYKREYRAAFEQGYREGYGGR